MICKKCNVKPILYMRIHSCNGIDMLHGKKTSIKISSLIATKIRC